MGKIRQIVIEAHDEDGQVERITALLKKNGYAVVVEEDNYIAGSGLFNVYATRRGENGSSGNGTQERKLFPVPVLPDSSLTVSELRQYLQSKLPEYLVPSAFVFLESLPLSPTGKVDRQALPAPDQDRPNMQRAFEAARTPVEQQLTEIWAGVLKIKCLGVHDNFFELGGDSILGTQFIARANQAGFSLTPKQLFQHPTITELAALAGTSQSIQSERPPASKSSTTRYSRARLDQKDIEKVIAKINKGSAKAPDAN